MKLIRKIIVIVFFSCFLFTACSSNKTQVSSPSSSGSENEQAYKKSNQEDSQVREAKNFNETLNYGTKLLKKK